MGGGIIVAIFIKLFASYTSIVLIAGSKRILCLKESPKLVFCPICFSVFILEKFAINCQDCRFIFLYNKYLKQISGHDAGHDSSIPSNNILSLSVWGVISVIWDCIDLESVNVTHCAESTN